jgi:hypothetical protein
MQDLASTLILLSTTPQSIDALLRPLPAPFADVNEAEGTWTIAQIVAHLIHCERTDWMTRTLTILRAGDTETFSPLDREANFPAVSPLLPQLLTEFLELRATNLTHLRALNLTPQDLTRTGRHPAFGIVTLSQLLATWATHDLTHLHQLSRTLAHQNRDAVGPWQQYLGVLHCNGHSS